MRYIPLAFVLLAGCASLADIQESSVDRSGTTNKPVDEVSQCISMKIAAAPIKDKDGNQLFLLKNMQHVIQGTLTLVELDTGTRIDHRQANSIAQNGFWRKCL